MPEAGDGAVQEVTTAAEQLHKDRVARLGCVVCLRVHDCYTPPELHHVAEGSGIRSDFAIAPLCRAHHTGTSGFHKRGSEFLKQFRVPGESEYGLIIWTNEDLARYDLFRGRRD